MRAEENMTKTFMVEHHNNFTAQAPIWVPVDGSSRRAVDIVDLQAILERVEI